MAYVTLIQDWLTIQNNGASTVIQAEDQWLDMADFLDVIFYVSTQQVTGTTPTLNLKTSPSRDDALFATMQTQVLAATTNYTLINRFAVATVPLSRWVRWELTGTTISVTFRIYAAATTQGALLRR